MSTALEKYLSLQNALKQFNDHGDSDIADEIRNIMDEVWSNQMTKEDRDIINKG
jgi:hypothetical protein